MKRLIILILFLSCGIDDIDKWPDQCFDVGKLKCRNGIKTYCNWNMKYFNAYICSNNSQCNKENDGQDYCTENKDELFFLYLKGEDLNKWRCCKPKEE